MSNPIHFGIKDTKNKIIMLWTPKAGCSVSCLMMFNHMGLMEKTSSTRDIHAYRTPFYKKYGYTCPNDLTTYFVFKMIVNPYQRAVSCYKVYSDTFSDHSFHQFLQIISEKKTNHLSPHILNHIISQYVTDEKSYINAYIKIENGQKEIDEKINRLLGLNLSISGLTADHHTIREETDQFFGYIPRNQIVKFPKSYRQFYDNDEIKNLVEIIYDDDIRNYEYSFDDPF